MDYTFHKSLEAQRSIADSEKCGVIFVLYFIGLRYEFPLVASPDSQQTAEPLRSSLMKFQQQE